MIQLLGYLFLSLVLAIAIVVGDYFLPGSFLNNFLNSGFIETFAALVGLNIAAATFLVGNLNEMEQSSAGAFDFTRSKFEIKQNIYFLLIVFVLDILILTFRPDLSTVVSFDTNKLFYILNVLVLTLFGLGLSAIFEILKAVFVAAERK